MKRKSLLSASLSQQYVSPTQETVSVEYAALVLVLSLIACGFAGFGLLVPKVWGWYDLPEAWCLTQASFRYWLWGDQGDALHWALWFESLSSEPKALFRMVSFGVAGSSVVISIALAVWALVSSKQSSLLRLSGAQLLTGKKAIKSLKASLAKENKAFGKGVSIHPDIILPTQREKQGCLIVGQVGSGKTQVMLGMLQEVVESKSKCVTFDVKGDFSRYFLHRDHVVLLAPWDSRSVQWSLAKDINTEHQASLFAEALIEVNSNDPMWGTSARLILTGCMVSLLTTKGQDWGWQSLSELLNEPVEELQRLLMRHYPQAAKLVDPKSKTSQSMLLTLYGQVKPIHQLAKAWGNAKQGISLIEWVKTDSSAQSHLIIQSHTDYVDLSKSLADLALYFISQSLLGMPDDSQRSVYFFLDEVAQLKFSNLPNFLSLGRSKGAKLFLGVQDLNLLARYFSKEEIAAISSMIACLVVLRVSGVGDTLSLLSKSLGSQQVERLATTFDYRANNTYSWQYQTLPVVPEAEISQLPQASKNGVVGFLSIAGTGVVAKLRWPLQRLESASDSVVWAGWTKPVDQSSTNKFGPVEKALDSAFEESVDA